MYPRFSIGKKTILQIFLYAIYTKLPAAEMATGNDACREKRYENYLSVLTICISAALAATLFTDSGEWKVGTTCFIASVTATAPISP